MAGTGSSNSRGALEAPPEDLSGSSALDRLGEFVDRHLRIIRMVPWIMGGIGAVLIIRNTYFLTQFTRCADIPHHMLAGNATLYGRVVCCHGDSLGVWHVPTGRRMLRWRTAPPENCASDLLINVKFSGVAITASTSRSCHHWLRTNLLNRPIKFQLLCITSASGEGDSGEGDIGDGASGDSGDTAVECIVYSRKQPFWTYSCNVNRALIQNGFGTLTDAKGFRDAKSYAHFMTGMGRSEMAAKRSGAGMWLGTGYESLWTKLKHWITKLRNKT